MIDTVVLRIHNIQDYEKTFNLFFSSRKKTVTTAYVDEATGEYVESVAQLATIFADTGRCIPLVQRNSINLGSSHYSVAYSINVVRNYLEFNFSIPKFIYGTNVLEFVSNFDSSVSQTWVNFSNFLFKFLKENLPDRVLFYDVEINRIDFCYNQFFATKEDAFDYLERQKEIVLKYARSDANSYRSSSYRTSWQYVTDRYSYKVYHKGTEFTKHDLPELMKKGRNPKGFDLDFFLKNADRILRYEMTIRSSFFNYLWQQIYFHSDDSSDYHNYGDPGIRCLLRTLEKSAVKVKGHTLFEKFIGRQKKFTLASAFDVVTDPVQLLQQDRFTFDRNFFYCAYDQFLKRLHKFQLSKLVSVRDASRKVDSYNESAKVKNSLRRNICGLKDKPRIMAFAMLSQFVSLDQLKPFITERAYYRLKKDMDFVGFSANATDLQVVLPRTDYWDYFLSFGKYHSLYI